MRQVLDMSRPGLDQFHPEPGALRLSGLPHVSLLEGPGQTPPPGQGDPDRERPRQVVPVRPLHHQGDHQVQADSHLPPAQDPPDHPGQSPHQRLQVSLPSLFTSMKSPHSGV